MSLTLLFDLDDTLLDTNIEAFIPAYFQALSEHLAPYVSTKVMLPALIAGMRLMLDSENPSRTLQDIFEEDFYQKLGIPKQELAEVFDDFYDNIFPKIESKTTRRPDAAPLIEWASSKGYRIAIATDPFFPQKATHHRLRWAGLAKNEKSRQMAAATKIRPSSHLIQTFLICSESIITHFQKLSTIFFQDSREARFLCYIIKTYQ